MALVTLRDGKESELFDTDTMSIASGGMVYLRKHCLRMHVYDKVTQLATEQFVTRDRKVQDAIMAAMRKGVGHIDQRNGWIKPRVSRHEFVDASAERRMVQKDLEQYFGNDVEIRGTHLRKIYYISDGNMKSTPDNIGMRFGSPLIFDGVAVATIFDIGGLDPLSPDWNVVYWLTKPMWDGFHTRRRGVPKEFPWPTGFVASKWCQRDGYDSYGDGHIHLASMTQGQTVGSWALTSLRLFWMERQSGKDIFAKYGETFKPGSDPGDQAFQYLVKAMSSSLGLGLIGMYCSHCGSMLPKPYSTCKCGWDCSTYEARRHTYCKNCGQSLAYVCDSCGDKACASSTPGFCKCGATVAIKPTHDEHNKQYNMFYSKGQQEVAYNVIKL